MTRLRMAVVGVGHLGRHHARILAGLPDVDLVGVVDPNREQAAAVAAPLRTRAYDRPDALFGRVDAVSVVTPTSHHHAVAAEFLRRGVPVLVEKPMCRTAAEADDLIRVAAAAAVPLQVGHIERFNPAFEELAKRPIRPKFVEAERHGSYTGRGTDVGVVLDLMIHDLDLVLSLVGAPVRDVSAVGAAVFGGHEDVVNARLVFETGCVAHLTASRVSLDPKRRLRAWSPEGYAGIDFVTRTLSLVQVSDAARHRIVGADRFDDGADSRPNDGSVGRRLEVLNIDGDRAGDQLTAELRHFVDCVRANRTPRVNGEAGRDALALAERVLAAVQLHQWDGVPDGAVGPDQLPWPAGKLFDLPKGQSEAA